MDFLKNVYNISLWYTKLVITELVTPEKQSVVKLKRDFNLRTLLKGLNNIEQTNILLVFRNEFVA